MRRPSHQSSVSPARSCTRRPSELFRVRSVLRCAVFGGHLLDEIDKLTLLQTGSALFPPRGQDSPQLQHSHFRQSIPAPVENRMLCVRRTRMPFKPLSLQIFQTLCAVSGLLDVNTAYRIWARRSGRPCAEVSGRFCGQEHVHWGGDSPHLSLWLQHHWRLPGNNTEVKGEKIRITIQYVSYNLYIFKDGSATKEE